MKRTKRFLFYLQQCPYCIIYATISSVIQAKDGALWCLTSQIKAQVHPPSDSLRNKIQQKKKKKLIVRNICLGN